MELNVKQNNTTWISFFPKSSARQIQSVNFCGFQVDSFKSIHCCSSHLIQDNPTDSHICATTPTTQPSHQGRLMKAEKQNKKQEAELIDVHATLSDLSIPNGRLVWPWHWQKRCRTDDIRSLRRQLRQCSRGAGWSPMARCYAGNLK